MFLTNLPTLPPNRAHLWSAVLDVEPVKLKEYFRTLSGDERNRASCFNVLKYRHRFVAARGILRHILSHYVGRDPEQLRFGYGPYGKPFLQQHEGGIGALRFNLAHSHEMALYCFVRDREVGVDIERIDPTVAYQQVAEHFFSAGEVAAMLTLKRSLRMKAFFDCWTRKEAYVKAQGTGMQKRLDSFDVSLTSGDSPALVSGGDGTWSFHAPMIAVGYAAAVAVQGKCQFEMWKWKSTQQAISSVSYSHRAVLSL
jgi:4'-phosphopantetheinyl transferase